MAIALPRREPWYTPRKLWGYLKESRRYPVFPTFMLMLVLIVPAIFAAWVAPHDPLKGALRERLRPPAWMNDKFTDKIVVEDIEPGKFSSQITLAEAQRRFDLKTVKPYGETTKTVVEDVEEGASALQITLEDARQQLLAETLTILGGGGEIFVGTEVLARGTTLDREMIVLGGDVEVRTDRGGSTKNLLGTDKLGRDILSRIIYGSRVSIIVAGMSIIIGAVVGSALGIMAAYYMGWADAIIMRLVDISLSIPIILLALVLVATVGPSFRTVIFVLAVLMWARFARLARGEALSVKTQDYIARARVAGCSDFRIMVVHIFPNIFNSLIVLATLWVGFVIILEATLSFLGAGIPRPTAAWGLMVADGRELVISAWWVAFFPGIAILLTVMSSNLLGDWLRDKLDPKQRQV